VLLLDEYALRVRDLGSKNGTFLNDRRLGSAEVILNHGDLLSIGEMCCQVDLLPQSAAGPAHPAVLDTQPIGELPTLDERPALPAPAADDTHQFDGRNVLPNPVPASADPPPSSPNP
jgi:hypothetical protein